MSEFCSTFAPVFKSTNKIATANKTANICLEVLRTKQNRTEENGSRTLKLRIKKDIGRTNRADS